MNMGKTLVMLHTTPVAIPLFGPLAREVMPPGTNIRTITDDSLLDDVRRAGHLTKDVVRRVVGHIQHAEAYGADCVLFTCSSVGPAIDVARQVVNIPVFKVDEPMAEKAIEMGSSLAVLATLPTTLSPTKDLIVRAGMAAGRDVSIDTLLCNEAFDALTRGDVKQHNVLLMQVIVQAATTHDAIVLAQASMSNIVRDLPPEVASRVLTSPRLGLERVAAALRAMS
jgi:Asp/Glu/hydantoin racemase